MNSITISFDFELGWGVCDNIKLFKQRQEQKVYSSLRPLLSELVPFLEKNDIRTTWAMVGAMFEEDVNSIDLEHLPETYKKCVSEFLLHSERESWNAQDLVSLFINVNGLDIGTHTYSHLYGDFPESTSNNLSTDIDKSIVLLERTFDASVRSIVFPRDQVRYISECVLNKNLDCRLNPSFLYGNKMDKYSKRIVSLAIPHRSVLLNTESSLFHVGSQYFNYYGGKYPALKKLMLRNELNNIYKSSLKKNSTDSFHLWLHPFNLIETPGLYNLFVDWLVEMSRLKNKGLVRFNNMADIRCDINDYLSEYS